MKVFSFKNELTPAQTPLNLEELKQVKGGSNESHDLIPTSTGIYGGGGEEPPAK